MRPRRRGLAYHHTKPKGQLSQGHYPTKCNDGQRRKVGNSEAFQSFDIWKNLDRIRSTKKNAGQFIKGSLLILPMRTEDKQQFDECMDELHKYISKDILRCYPQKEQKDEGMLFYIVLKDFNILDSCFVLSVLLAFQKRLWMAPSEKSYFRVPKNINLTGSFYLPKNIETGRGHIITSYRREQPSSSIVEVGFNVVPDFQQFQVKACHVSKFMNELSNFFSQVEFGKCEANVINYFKREYNRTYSQISLALYELPLIGDGLFDIKSYISKTRPIIETSKAQMIKHISEMKAYNEISGLQGDQFPRQQRPLSNSPSSNSISSSQTIEAGATSYQTQPQRHAVNKPSNLLNSSNRHSGPKTFEDGRYSEGNKPGFMTQDEIKQHCIGTIKASMDAVKKKSSYQILKTYVRCPRQNYIDIVYQNLNDLRSKTNCNIVVLNLNNLHESQMWLESLNTTNYTLFAQAPHPSTIRVISIGGVGEYIVKALELILNILEH
ncbi:BBM_1a_G0010840.mRNA.1.CDS.1 [Saccharomyces cerevisiae]|nr:Snu56p [Saccharomyces cerevisiae YJM1399]CAI4355270.1 ADE_G0010780.mRNA.1.CDS.1 [Saccharomyces cerevisiae]CAI4358558.1 BBM_1a_G0010840.mRNA.1.CDS.1 [Saccharomyces cerevisiae]CAI6564987.1 ADE_G0010780.mRNA.1.CDS.1 [Saccharomyces cerevisiae]CAI7075809.1 BBM_1a_G0010840.mRNA.1.CDS.1 [Saccharomyces cerevisiae]